MTPTRNKANLTTKRRHSTLATITIALATLLGGNAAMAQPKVPMVRKAGSNLNYAPGRVLVRMNPSNASATAKGKPSLPGVRSIENLTGNTAGVSAKATGQSPWVVAHLNDDVNVEQALATLAADPTVASVTPDYILSIPHPVSGVGVSAADPNEGQQYALERIEAAAAWQVESGKKSVVVAVVDTGTQTDHPDLAAQIWTNPRETANGVDDDGDGFIDDVHGWNFVANNNDPTDDNKHGTHCSGIIAATRGNGQGIAGTANVSIMPVKVLNSEGSGSTSDIIKGVQYAVDHGASIISMSLGGTGFEQAFADVCRDAIARNVVIVAANGNDSANTISYPAGYEGVIAVSATDQNDQIASFSNTGEGTAIAAPGVEILSTLVGSTYGNLSGTSMATPYVAGVAALVRSANPNLTAAQVRERLMNTADDLGTPGYDTVYGAGRVNARKALANEAAPTPSPTPNPAPTPGGNTTPDKARPIQPGQITDTCRNELWYSITLTRSAKIDLSLSGNQGDLDLFLMDPNGQALDQSANDGSSEQINATLAAGRYLIAVSAYEGKSGSFAMTFRSSAATPGNPGTPDPIGDPGYPGDGNPGDGFTPGTGGQCGAGSGLPMMAMVAGLMGFGSTIRSSVLRKK